MKLTKPSVLELCSISPCWAAVAPGAGWETKIVKRERARQSGVALLVVDVQRGLFRRSAPIHEGERLLETITALTRRAHRAGAPVVYIQHAGKTMLVRGSEDWRLHPRLRPRKSDCIIPKSHVNAFEETVLTAELNSRQVGNVVVTGLVTHACVRATCIGAKTLGYRVILVRDGHSNYSAHAAQVIQNWNEKLSAGGTVELQSAADIEFGGEASGPNKALKLTKIGRHPRKRGYPAHARASHAAAGTASQVNAGVRRTVGGTSAGDELAGRRASVAKKPRTIDEFLASLSDDKRAALEKLRQTIRAAAPKAEECISYGVPAFRLGGKFLVAFGAGVNHCAFYPGGTAMEAHRAELARYDTSKGTIRFQPKAGLPVGLVRGIVKSRMVAIQTRTLNGGGRGKSDRPVENRLGSPRARAGAARNR
jgi:nicotinamidase-related amidase/uncharacterized protein YdhG (YjbR/CyaY superfamily)